MLTNGRSFLRKSVTLETTTGLLRNNRRPNDLMKPPKINARDIVYEDQYQQIYKILADFGNFKKEYFVRDSGSRTGVLVINDNSVLLIRQYRLLINGPSWEIPGGKIETGESPESAATRECFEETGCKVKKIFPIQSYFVSPGSSESFYYLYLGEIESFDGVRLKGIENEDEDILVSGFKVDQVKKMLNDKIIINGLTLIALQWFFLNYYKS